MSEGYEATPDAPRRGRPPREQAQEEIRRRRTPGSLNRMTSYKLDIFGPEQLDLDNFVYLWANDEGANIRNLTTFDDYEFVNTSDISGIDPNLFDSESDDRIRILAGRQDGVPLYTYYLRKRREFWEEDQEAIVRAREDMMAGRVYEGAPTESGEGRPGGTDKFYAPRGTQIGHAARRRSGPVPRSLK